MPASRSRRKIKTSRYHWGISIIIAVLLVGLGLLELMLRRDTGASAYLLNKSVAGAGFLMIALSYSLSAIHYLTRRFESFFSLRRPFGLTGYWLAVLHLLLTLTVTDPEAPGAMKFPFPEYFLGHWPAILISLLAFIYFSYAFKISVWPGKLLQSSGQRWRRRLRYGYVAVLAALVHAVLLKFEGWISWLPTMDPALPPLSLITAAIGLLLILLKTWQLSRSRRLF